MPRGRIKFFNDRKGYGFIESEKKDSIFVHNSSIKQDGYRTLEEGQEVWFDVKESPRGLEAVNVHKI
ncbi:MAG: cold shock domain-containing protein [bacterium]|nr:cold shock domain-containing protein [bacterium]